MSNADIRGRFVWHELMTTDTKAAGAFYPKVTNWKTQAWEKDPSYTMWAVAKGPFGGLRPLPDAARAVGPHWLPYIGTPDVDATVHSAQALGARVTMGATDIPDVGRFAVLADPQGALFAIYSSTSTGGSMPEAFSWHELSTSDPVGALRFYGALFGWSEVATHDMGPMGVYHLVGFGGVASIGMWTSSAESPTPAHWLSYAHVADIDKSSNAVKTAGGKLLRGPMEVPGGTWIAQATDPQGATFALHADKRLAAATPQPAKASAPTSVSAGAAAKPQASRPPASGGAGAAASGRSQSSESVSAPKPAAASTAKKVPAKKARVKKVAAKKATAKRGAARKSAAKKSRTKRSSARPRPQRKAKRIAKRGMKSAAVKRRSAKQRKSSRRRTAPGRLAVARRFAAKQADSILKRLRGKKRR